ncbi:DUF397 domain-containing protein [Micromonospora zamorensis]|uniref:DUF397 domain-containing protein n=1 Tax=Micromonospora zamorensis TaxID=709883 RepID=UPI00368A46DA
MIVGTSDRLVWRKSSYSDNNGGACIEVAELVTSIVVRDSKNPSGSNLRFTRGAWTRFVRSIR